MVGKCSCLLLPVSLNRRDVDESLDICMSVCLDVYMSGCWISRCWISRCLGVERSCQVSAE